MGAAVGGAVYNVVSIYSYGNTALASYTSALAEATTNEVVSYITEEKQVSCENIVSSIDSIANDTLVNGTMYYMTGRMAEKIIPGSASPNPRKTKVRTVLRTPWGVK